MGDPMPESKPSSFASATRDGGIEGLADRVTWHATLARAAVRGRLFQTTAESLSFGRYVWRRSLGVGGMGTVVIAHDPELGREVAIKLVEADSPRVRASVVREAQAHARITHANVASVYDVGVAGSRVFIVMELVVGRDLARWGATDRPWREVVDAWLEIAEGIAAVHAAGLVHCDVKPSNAIMGDDGRARLIDFGVARALARTTLQRERIAETTEGPTEAGQTDPEARGGTPAYMAPEQILGAELDGRVDQFSWCVSLWEALCGTRPGGSIPALQSLDGPWPPSAPQRPDAPRRLWTVLCRGLAVEPRDRFASMHELIDAVRHAIGATRTRTRIAALGLVGAAALGVWGFSTPRDDGACGERIGDAAEIWDAATSDAARSHFVDTLPGLHATLWPRVDAATSAWVAQWQAERAAVCAADPPDAAAARCLTWSLAETRAMVDVLGRGDAEALTREADRALARTPPSRCRDAAALANQPPLAPPTIEAEVGEIRERLHDAAQLRERGEPMVALNVAESAVADAAAIDFPPLQIEAAVELGVTLADTGPWDRARSVLEDAYASADRERYIVEATRAAGALAAILADELREPEAAEIWSRRALMSARAAGVPALLTAAERRVASTAAAAGRSAEALELLRGLRARLSRECPAPCAALVDIEADLSQLLDEQGDFAAAEEHARAAIATAIEVGGEDHLRTGAGRNRLCGGLMRQRRHDEALQECRSAWTIVRNVYGDEHTNTASALAMLATVELTAGDTTTARGQLEQAYDVFERLLGPDHRQTQAAASNLALAAMYDGDHAAAIRGFSAVLAVLEEDPSVSPAELSTVLRALAEAHIGSGDHASSVEPLARALAIGEAAGHSAELLAGIRTRLGLALVELERLAEAQVVLSEAIAAEPESDTLYNTALRRCTLARAMARSDRPRAIRLIDEALRRLGTEEPDLATECRATREAIERAAP